METGKYSRFNWKTEAFSLPCLILLTYDMFQLHYRSSLMTEAFLCWFIYVLLTVIIYFSLSPANMFDKPEASAAFGDRTELSAEEAESYISSGLHFIVFFKFYLSVIPFTAGIVSVLMGGKNSMLTVLVTVALLFTAFMMITLAVQNFIKARGYTRVTFGETVRKGLFYCNPDDSRAILDKTVGTGTTVNLATKEGRMILWVILAIPATIITLIVLLKLLSGK
jgi:hypothetical protein